MMGFAVFGTLDLIAYPVLNNRIDIVAGTTRHIKPSMSPCYSSYGFALPLQPSGIPLDVLLDRKFPIQHTNVKAVLNQNHRYVLVDHDGRLWKICVQVDQKNKEASIVEKLVMTYTPISNNDPADWWVVAPQVAEDNHYIDMLIGFLYNNPPMKKIEAFTSRYLTFQELNWISISKIKKELNESFPKEELIETPV